MALLYREKYLEISPPDMRGLPDMIAKQIYLTLMARPTSCFETPNVLASWLEKKERELQAADIVISHLYQVTSRHQERTTVNFVLKHKQSLIDWTRQCQEWKEPENNDFTFVPKDLSVITSLQLAVKHCSYCGSTSVKLKKFADYVGVRLSSLQCVRELHTNLVTMVLEIVDLWDKNVPHLRRLILTMIHELRYIKEQTRGGESGHATYPTRPALVGRSSVHAGT
ncbi:hypothetical protein HK102_000649 [Quaeritorhiza haematococci]|nr:hypothetical protein HK102_000649 [Quaeritorhiza haematococci]